MSRPGQSELRHRLGNMALLGHCGNDLRRTFGGTVRIAVRRKFRRRFHKAGENGRLRQTDCARTMAEIFLSGGFDTIGARAEIHTVEIEFEDLVLRIFMLQPQCQYGFLPLA